MQKTINELYDVLEEAASICKSDYISLSGGLDSSILAYLLKEKNISAVAIITKDFVASDLTYCQMISSKLGLPLDLRTESTEELLSAIEETIKILKIFNNIEIRNSVVMYLALNAIKEKGHNGIITGDGADELFAGYSFFLNKNEKELQNDLERIWDIMHFPTKKIGEALGVKVETPFLFENVVEFAKNVPVNLKVKEENGKKFGKWILRKAFEKKLPNAIVWRKKVPVQDGSGTSGLTNLFDVIISNDVFKTRVEQIQEQDNVIIQSKESLHYYDIYKKFFKPPFKLHSSESKCPFCQWEIKPDTKFCRMCGSFPI